VTYTLDWPVTYTLALETLETLETGWTRLLAREPHQLSLPRKPV